MEDRKTSPKYSPECPEVRERAERMVLDHAGEYSFAVTGYRLE